MARASIAIFPKKVEYSDNRPCPETPPEVFEAVQRVVKNGDGCELIRCKSGLYVIKYSKTGPGIDPVGWDGWLPIYVVKTNKWSSGGVQQKEMNEFIKERTNED